MLHLFAFAPDDEALLRQAVSCIEAGDDIVLLDRGRHFADSTETLLAALPADVRVHVLGPDSGPDARIAVLDADGLVALSERHQASLSWYPEEL